MKKLAVALVMVAGTSTFTFAQNADTITEARATITKAEFAQVTPAKKEITLKEVPAEVQKAYMKDSEGKEIKSIYKVTNEETKAVSYEFVVTANNKDWSISYDDKGNKIATEEKV